MASSFKQDMPPKGGYSPIDFRRALPKRGFSGFAMILGGIGVMGVGTVLMVMNYDRRKRLVQEDRESAIGFIPLLQAERDRLYLRQLKHVREQEAIIMEGVEGFKPGESCYYNDGAFTVRMQDLLYLSPKHVKEQEQRGYTLGW